MQTIQPIKPSQTPQNPILHPEKGRLHSLEDDSYFFPQTRFRKAKV